MIHGYGWELKCTAWHLRRDDYGFYCSHTQPDGAVQHFTREQLKQKVLAKTRKLMIQSVLWFGLAVLIVAAILGASIALHERITQHDWWMSSLDAVMACTLIWFIRRDRIRRREQKNLETPLTP